jgi:hypothetical protein|tara:strand:+ start:823 stop:1248 length:426 start_codon:yes stop_codon:yes gene_type:complete
MYICITEVDAVTKIPCTVEPQRTGPSMPFVKGWVHIWHDSSTWPVTTAPDGTYLRAPKYYGTCDDDADTSIAGVLQVLTEAEFNAAKVSEHEARRPYPSWIGYLDTMTWGAPVPRPANAIMNGGNVRYQWDEATVNWIPWV